MMNNDCCDHRVKAVWGMDRDHPDFFKFYYRNGTVDYNHRSADNGIDRDVFKTYMYKKPAMAMYVLDQHPNKQFSGFDNKLNVTDFLEMDTYEKKNTIKLKEIAEAERFNKYISLIDKFNVDEDIKRKIKKIEENTPMNIPNRDNIIDTLVREEILTVIKKKLIKDNVLEERTDGITRNIGENITTHLNRIIERMGISTGVDGTGSVEVTAEPLKDQFEQALKNEDGVDFGVESKDIHEDDEDDEYDETVGIHGDEYVGGAGPGAGTERINLRLEVIINYIIRLYNMLVLKKGLNTPKKQIRGKTTIKKLKKNKHNIMGVIIQYTELSHNYHYKFLQAFEDSVKKTHEDLNILETLLLEAEQELPFIETNSGHKKEEKTNIIPIYK